MLMHYCYVIHTLPVLDDSTVIRGKFNVYFELQLIM
jgi:hypothetical protein